MVIQNFKMIENISIDSLHDCSTSSIELIDNKLEFHFNKEGIGTLLPNGEEMYPYNSLNLSFILAKDIDYKKLNDCSVKQINEREKTIKKAIRHMSLIELLNYLNDNNGNLRFYAQYYNQRKCLIYAELIIEGKWQSGNWFEIELSVDEIIFEWN